MVASENTLEVLGYIRPKFRKLVNSSLTPIRLSRNEDVMQWLENCEKRGHHCERAETVSLMDHYESCEV